MLSLPLPPIAAQYWVIAANHSTVLLCHLQLAPVRGVQLVVPPGVEEVLAVAVEGEVEHEVVFAAQQKVADGAGLGLGEGRGAAECFLARVVASAVAAPVVAEVPVEVHSLALLQHEDVMLVEVNVSIQDYSRLRRGFCLRSWTSSCATSCRAGGCTRNRRGSPPAARTPAPIRGEH